MCACACIRVFVERKKSSSRHRSSPSRRSSTPNDSQKSSRKSSHDSKSKSADSSANASSVSHKYANSVKENCHSTANNIDKLLAPPHHERDMAKSALDHSQSPIVLNKDVDLRSQLLQPLCYVASALPLHDHELIAPVSMVNHNMEVCEKSKLHFSLIRLAENLRSWRFSAVRLVYPRLER